MSISEEYKTQVETLAWITNDEAEFWTNSKPVYDSSARQSQSSSPGLKNNFSNGTLPDGEYFKYGHIMDNQYEKAKSDANQNEKTLKTKQINNVIDDDVFNSNENIYAKATKIPDTNMGFFGRLFHQLTRPSISIQELFSDNEKSVQQNSNGYSNEKNNNLLNINNERSFIDDLIEEFSVLRGNLDQEALINRRSLDAKARLSNPYINPYQRSSTTLN